MVGPNEPSATGGSLGGDPNYAQYRAGAERQGFMSNMRSFGSALSNIGKFNKDVEALTGSNGTIAKLQSALEGLTARLNSVGIGSTASTAAVHQPGLAAAQSAGGVSLGTNPATFTNTGGTPYQQQGGGGGNQPPTTASSTGPSGGANPHAGFGAYVAAGTYAAAQFAGIWGSRAQTTMSLAPEATQLQQPGGLTYQQVNQTLANRTLSYGTQGPQDTLQAAAAAQQISGQGILGPNGRMANNFRNTMGNLTTLSLANPGMSMTDAANMYAQLRSPYVNWMGQGLGLPTFTGQNRGAPSISGVATQYLQSIIPSATQAQRNDPRFLFNQFTGNQSAAAAGRELLGGDAQLQSVLNTAVMNLTYRQRTGGRQGDIFSDIQGDRTGKYINPGTGQYTNRGWRQYEREARLGGMSNDVISQERNLQNLDSKNSLIFSASQETNIGRMVALQIDIKQILQGIAQKMGVTGPLAGPISQAAGAIKNPLTDLLLLNALGKGGVGGQLLSKIGGVLPEGAAGAFATAAPWAGLGIGALLAGGITGGIVKQHTHGNRLGGALGGAGGGAAVGAGVGLLGGPFDPISVPVGAGVGALIGGIGGLVGDAPMSSFDMGLSRPGIGDATSGDDVSILQAHNATGDPNSVTGLNAQFRHDLACMFRDNPKLVLNSGYRDNTKQKQLYDNYRKYGGAPVAPPGQSMHNKGLAADIGPNSQYGWLHSHGGKYGLVNFTEEAWHWELAGASNAGNRSNYGVAPDPKVCTGTATGGGGGGGATSASGSTGASPDVSLGGTGGGSGGGMYPSDTNPMYALVGSGTEAGARRFVGQTTVSLSNTNSGSAGAGSSGSGALAGSQGVGGPSGPLPTGGDKRVPGHSITDWANSLLTYMGITPTDASVRTLIQWANTESGGYNPKVAGGLYNPLNTTESHFGYWRNGGAQGNIKDYKSFTQGIDNQGWNLLYAGGASDPFHYRAIVAGLRSGDANATFKAINASSFGTHFAVGDAPMGPTFGGSSEFLRTMRGGVGDAPARPTVNGGGGGVAVIGAARSINANFTINVQGASQVEAEGLAQYAWKRIKQLEAQEAQRSN